MNQCLLSFGNLSPPERMALSMVADRAGLDLRLTNTVDNALRSLAQHPRLVIVDNTNELSEQVCLEVRTRPELAHMPIIVVAKELDDLCFAEVFGWGGDDVVSLITSRPLQERLRHLPRVAEPASPQHAGVAVIADPDPTRRAMLARVLRPAGYSIKFAATADDMVQCTADPALKLAVIDLELHPEPTRIIMEGHWKTPDAIWIVKCPPKDLLEQRKALEGLRNSAAIDGFSPPENVVYLANEMKRGEVVDLRASRRLLYGTRVAFREAGRDQDDYGYSYNISEGGFYVRTLAPPDEKTVWLELRPPRTDHLIRLEGEVVWRRTFGPAKAATTPPGFGVRISDGTRADLGRWRYGYAAFSEMLGFPSISPDR